MSKHIMPISMAISVLVFALFTVGCGTSTKASIQPISTSTVQLGGTVTATATNAPFLDARFTSEDGLYAFQYRQENWSKMTVNDPDFPAGNGWSGPDYTYFYVLPATQVVAPSDYPAIMTTFWHSTTDPYVGTSPDIAPFTAMPDVTVGGNTWTVGASYYNGGGSDAQITYYALVHDGKSFFVTTGITTNPRDFLTYLQPMLASFQFLK